jgi:SPX domain protein involved in polyphosphate accumulation
MLPILDRTEFKFVISTETEAKIIEEVEKHTTLDQLAGGCAQYPIITQYYDNEDRDCYWEKQRGQKSRRKLRLRVYGHEGGAVPPTVFLEVKHKYYGRGVKRRLNAPLDELMPLVRGEKTGGLRNNGHLSRGERMIVSEVGDLIEKRKFKFLCTMRYDRRAYVGDDESPDLRITFDTGIACRFKEQTLVADSTDFEHYLLPDDQAIMEVKTTTFIPIWLRDLIGRQGLVRQSYSKFCTALERHDPVVRASMYGPNAIPISEGFTPQEISSAMENTIMSGQ